MSTSSSLRTASAFRCIEMKAVVYKKPFEVAVEDVPRPELTHPDDIIVKGGSIPSSLIAAEVIVLSSSHDYMYMWKVCIRITVLSSIHYD